MSKSTVFMLFAKNVKTVKSVKNAVFGTICGENGEHFRKWPNTVKSCQKHSFCCTMCKNAVFCMAQRRALRSDTFSTFFVDCKSNFVEIGDLGECYAESIFGHRVGFWAVRAAVCAVGPTRPKKSRHRQQPNFEIPWRA